MLELEQLKRSLSPQKSQSYYLQKYNNFMAYAQAHKGWFKEQLQHEESCQLITQILEIFLREIPQSFLLANEFSGYIPNFFVKNPDVLQYLAHFPQIIAYLPGQDQNAKKVVQYVYKQQSLLQNPLQEVNIFGEICCITELALTKPQSSSQVINLCCNIFAVIKERNDLLQSKTIGSDSYNICFFLMNILRRVKNITIEDRRNIQKLVLDVVNYANKADPQFLIATQSYNNAENYILNEIFLILKKDDDKGYGTIIDNLFKIIQDNHVLKDFILTHDGGLSPLANFILGNQNIRKLFPNVMVLLQENPEQIFEDMQYNDKRVNYANLICRSFSSRYFFFRSEEISALIRLVSTALSSSYGIQALYRNYHENFGPLPAIFVINKLPQGRISQETLLKFIEQEDKHLFCKSHANQKSMVEVLVRDHCYDADTDYIRQASLQNLITVLQEFQNKEREVTKIPSSYLKVAQNVIGFCCTDKDLVKDLIEATGRNINFISLIYADIFRLFSNDHDYSRNILEQIVTENPKLFNSQGALTTYKRHRDSLKHKKKLSDQAKEQLVPIANLILSVFKDRPRDILKNIQVDEKRHLLANELDLHYSGVMQYMMGDLLHKNLVRSFTNFLILRNQDVPKNTSSTFKEFFKKQEIVKPLLANHNYATFLQYIIYIAAAHYIDEIQEIDILCEKGHNFFRVLIKSIAEIKADYSNDEAEFFTELSKQIKQLAYIKSYTEQVPEVSEMTGFAYRQREQIKLDMFGRSLKKYESTISRNMLALSENMQNLSAEKQRIFALACLSLEPFSKIIESSSLKHQTTEELIDKISAADSLLREYKFSEEELDNFEHNMQQLGELYLLITEDHVCDLDIAAIIQQIDSPNIDCIIEHLYIFYGAYLENLGDIELVNMQEKPRATFVQKEVDVTLSEGIIKYCARNGDPQCNNFIERVKKSQSLEEREKGITSYTKTESCSDGSLYI